MSKVLAIARAVAAELADYGAEVQFFPDYALKGLQTTRVLVIPASDEFNTLSRNAHEELPVIHVGVIRRATEDDVPELLTLVETIAKGFLRRRLAGATCVSAGFNPLFSPEHLRENGEFISVIELTFSATAP